ncbi:SpvB/TcaC N-terminal domain-containing protein [Massilia mucilaginosa]|uniref:SpvB/TcaC N-terminal domain-containing protein n=1 Tax=Massilia mucilaginosa TaxID=2609282 RepID=UPI001423E4B7
MATPKKTPSSIAKAFPSSNAPVTPSIQAPTGGGALRSVGEKFNTNAATGAASLSIPLPLTPGRSGLTPALELRYDTGTGNSVFGIGWQLTTAAITRKTDRGLPSYDDAEESDVFILVGAEDLVPAQRRDSSGADAPDEIDVDGFRVKRYRPRVEGLFARIERWTRTADAATHWRVTTRDNITSIYGWTGLARIEDPTNPLHVFSWLLEETRDDLGNVVHYGFVAEDASRIDAGAISELSRFVPAADGQQRFLANAQRYLRSVSYSNATALDTSMGSHFVPLTNPEKHDFLFRAVLRYGETEDLPWPVRQDPFSTCKPGFELRTYRLCHEVVMLHRFATLGAGWVPVRTLAFAYDQSPALTRLASVSLTGSIADAAADLSQDENALPPLEFSYSAGALGHAFKRFPAAALEGMPSGPSGAAARWVDLDGEGLPGMLWAGDSGWYYKANLSGRTTPGMAAGDQVTMSGPMPQRSLPVPSSLDQRQLTDLDGDGRLDMVKFSPPGAGAFARTEAGGWDQFRPMPNALHINWSDPNLRMVDLDCDGLADVLLAQADRLLWYRSRGPLGFHPAQCVRLPADEERGPNVLFNDAGNGIFLADMTGDGLADLVRVRHASVVYWPGLGRGRFGPKVTMGGFAPCDTADGFDARRLRLGDVDGSGTIDLLYITSSGVRMYANQAGNRFAAPVMLEGFPKLDATTSVDVMDLFGRGTACLVWSAFHTGGNSAPVGYLDLMPDGKPHLLNRIVNNYGGETRIEYAPSTYFYLKDKLTGMPWLTRLPFPVQCVRRTEHIDHIAQTRLTRSYVYHHGYYDGHEREFRGFARVDQRDAEVFSLNDTEAAACEGTSGAPGQPAVETRTWFHTGAWLECDVLELRLAREYFNGDAQARPLPDTLMPASLSIPEQREAARALRGTKLREEIYSLDCSEKQALPYSVTESRHAVQLIQAKGSAQHAVFQSYLAESVSYVYERNPADPRVSHALTLKIDEFGNVLESAAVAYPRRSAVEPEQLALLCTVTQARVSNRADQAKWRRIGVPIATRSSELTGMRAPAGGALFSCTELADAFAAATEISYEQKANGMGAERRTLKVQATRYYADDLGSVLPLGQAGRRALPHCAYALAFSADIIGGIYGAVRAGGLPFAEGGYVGGSAIGADAWIPSASYWTPSPTLTHDAAKFYVPSGSTDPWGNETCVTHDMYCLNVSSVLDALGKQTVAQYHYGAMLPSRIVDPNGDATEYAFNPLGLVVKTARVGRNGDGDTLDAPTTSMRYEWLRWSQAAGRLGMTGARAHPARVRSAIREKHGAARMQEQLVYSDGSGREIMTKMLAAAGPVPDVVDGRLVRDLDGRPAMRDSDTRWIGSGRVIHDNKGNPVKQYEPFFSDREEFETEQELVEWGVTPVLHYDPLGRPLRVLHPDGSWAWTEFDPWQVRVWDRNDTIARHATIADAESEWIQRARKSAYKPLRRAGELALKHRATPAVMQLDTLGRTFLHSADNGAQGLVTTRSAFDIEGRTLSVMDPLGREAARSRYDMADRPLQAMHMDSGTQLSFPDCAGQPLENWSARGYRTTRQYDAVRRPTHVYVETPESEMAAARPAPAGQRPPGNWLTNLFQADDARQAIPVVAARRRLASRMYYGEDRKDRKAARTARQLGQVIAVYDGAGLLECDRYDLNGNVEVLRRSLAREDWREPDWARLADITDSAAADSAAQALLQRGFLESQQRHDALGRQVEQTTPDRSRITTSFDVAGNVESIYLQQPGTAEAEAMLRSAQRNARGQVERCEAGNGVVTTYEYEPDTFRLHRIRSVRSAGATLLQDLRYTYDPEGNTTEVEDGCEGSEFFNGAVVAGGGQYSFDALYQIVQSSGREHPGAPYEHADPLKDQRPAATDMQALQRYTESYTYDAAGNLQEMAHKAGAGGGWTRHYSYDRDSNRLLATRVSQSQEVQYLHDAAGNMVSMPHLKSMAWNHAEQLVAADLEGGGEVFFRYGAGGERVRKVHQHGMTVDETIYFGGFEIHRRRGGPDGDIEYERETIAVMDGARCIARFETRTFDDGEAILRRAGMARYQLSDRLQSSGVELDERGRVISYEEYHAYGSTAFKSEPRSDTFSRKRYRYTGAERDEETKLDFRSARYYAAWLGRWTAADPAGATDGLNLYRYVGGRPTHMVDGSGLAGQVTEPLCTADDPTGQNSPRPTGDPAAVEKTAARYIDIGLMLATGVAGFALAGTLLVPPEPLSKVAAGAVAVYSADQISTAFRELYTAEIQPTLLESIVADVAVEAGMDRESAIKLGANTDFAAALAISLPWSAMSSVAIRGLAIAEDVVKGGRDVVKGVRIRQLPKFKSAIIEAENITTVKDTQSSIPRGLHEQLTWKEVLADPSKGNVLDLAKDARYPLDLGFMKMERTHIMLNGEKIQIHYQYNSWTKKPYDMKVNSMPYLF